MKVVRLKDFRNQEIRNKLLQIPFFRDVSAISEKELLSILHNSRVMNLSMGEVLLDHGAHSRCFYVLLEGELDVFVDKPIGKPISTIFGAQIFGALGAVNNNPRTATLAASKRGPAKVLCIDFSIFGHLSDFSHISLYTKLALFQNVVNNTRFKLENIQRQTHDMEFKEQLKRYQICQCKTHSLLHLQLLAAQAQGLGNLLETHNQRFNSAINVPEVAEEPSVMTAFMANVRNLLFKKVI